MHNLKLILLVIAIILVTFPIYAQEETETTQKCENNFQGFTCVSNPNREQLECKTGRVCDGDFCCGTTPNLFCCKQKTQQGDFYDISDGTSNVGDLVSEFRALSVSPGLTYTDIQDRSISNDVAARASYDQARGFFEIARLQREYLGVPQSATAARPIITTIGETTVRRGGPNQTSSSTNEIEEGMVFTEEEVAASQGTAPTEQPQATETTTIEQGESYNIVLDGSYAPNAIIHFSSQGKWEWCKSTSSWLGGNNECEDELKQITANSPSRREDIGPDSRNYRDIIRPLVDKNYDQGIENTISKVIDIAALTRNYVNLKVLAGNRELDIEVGIVYPDTGLNGNINIEIAGQNFNNVMYISKLDPTRRTATQNYQAALDRIKEIAKKS